MSYLIDNQLLKTPPINYITYSNFENNATTGYANYADAAGTSPVDGTGGSPTVAIGTTNAALRGAYSGTITKDAANRQGEGISYDFTTDNADQAKLLQISFDYTVASGTFASGDVTVWIYDKTNSVLIQPAGYSIQGVATGTPSKFFGTFQTASNSTSYRLIWHVSTTSASAYSLKIDNVSVGPQIQANASIISDWTPYSLTIGATTTAPTPGVVTVNEARWRRVGDSMEINYNFQQTSTSGAAAGSGNYLFSLPPGYSIDSSKISASAAYLAPLYGSAGVTYGTSASSGYTGLVQPRDSTHLQIIVGNDTNNPSAFIGSTYLPLNGQATYNIGFNARVPIVGWSSSGVISQDQSSEGREVSMYAAPQVATGTLSNAAFNVTKLTATADKFGAYSASTGLYTCFVPGTYETAANVETQNGTSLQNGDQVFAKIYKNGTSGTVVSAALGTFVTGMSNRVGVVLPAAQVQCNAGDTLGLYTRVQLSGGAPAYTNTDYGTSLHIKKLGGNQTVTAAETVAARYTTSTTSASSGASTTAVFTAKSNDSHGSSIINGVFTAPSPGRYAFKAATGFNATGGNMTAGIYLNLAAQKNGSGTYSYGPSWLTTAITTPPNIGISDTIQLLAGETLQIQIHNLTGQTLVCDGTSVFNYFTVERVGNY